MRTDEIIIEVRVDESESAQRLALIQEKIQRLKHANKELKSEQKALNDELRVNGTLTGDQAKRLAEIAKEMTANTANLKELTAAEKMYTAQLNVATQGDRKFGDSLVELSAMLAQLKGEYRGLTAAQRESAEGKAMLKNIQDLDKALKDADYSMGDFQRNVGNYQSALLGLNGNVLKISQLFAGGFKQSMAAAGTALKQFGKTMLATPVGWIAAAVGALVAIFNKLMDAFKSSDDAGTALSVALAKLQPVVTVLNKVFVSLAEVTAKVVGAVTGAASAIIGFLVPSFREASKAATELVTAEDKLEDMQRDYTLASAERAKQIAELKKQERSDENLTFEERERIFQQIDELEKKDLTERVRIAKENARITEEKYKNEVNSSDEAKNAITEARAEVIKAETEYLTGTTRIAARAAEARRQEAKESEAAVKAQEEARRQAHEAWKRRQEERRRAIAVEREEMRKLEDMQQELTEGELERQRLTTRTGYERQIEDLRRRLEEEKDLNVGAREALNGQIKLLEEKMWKELSDIDEEELRRQAASVAVMTEEAARRATEAAKAAAAATAAEQQRIRDEYERGALETANQFQSRLNAVYGNAAETARIQAEQTASYYESLLSMDAATMEAMGLNEEKYKELVLKAEADMMTARQQSSEAFQAQAKEVASTMQAVTGALSSLYEAAAGDSEAYEKFKKAIAIVDATISLAMTIAAATTASTAGDPYTMAIRIAANVAAVTAQFATVIKSIKAAQVPTFEAGGIVPGSSWSGDNVNARLNSGEMVINRIDQQRLWEMVSTGAPAAGMDYDLLAVTVAEAVSQLPAPVLDYSEFTRFERKVHNIENLTKIN